MGGKRLYQTWGYCHRWKWGTPLAAGTKEGESFEWKESSLQGGGGIGRGEQTEGNEVNSTTMEIPRYPLGGFREKYHYYLYSGKQRSRKI